MFLDLLLLSRHLLSNILVFSTQPHEHCNISSCINEGCFLMNTIYRWFIFGPKYVIFPPHWSTGPLVPPLLPEVFLSLFPNKIQPQSSSQCAHCQTKHVIFLTYLENQMCNFSHPFSELTKHNCHPQINYHFQTWLLSQQPFSDQTGFKTILIWVAPIYTWSLFSAPPHPPPQKKEPKAKIRLNMYVLRPSFSKYWL